MSVRPSCVYQPACPGCPRFGEHGLAPARREQLAKLARDWGLPRALEQSVPGEGYRHRVRLSVRGRPGKVRIGLFEARSHRLVHIPRCPIHHPAIEVYLASLEPILNAARIAPYDENRHEGTLRAIQIAVVPESGALQVVLVVRQSLESPDIQLMLLRRIIGHFSEQQVFSVHLNSQPNRSNTLLGSHWECVRGPAVYRDVCAGASVFFPPDAFGQANPVLHERAASRIHEYIPPGGSVFEYYCGVGTIGLGLLKKNHPVRFNELGLGSLAGLRRGIRELGGQPGSVEIYEGKAGEFSSLYDPGETVVVDPPRKGLDGSLLDRLCSDPPWRVIYLSCGFDSFLRECELLKGSGRLRLIHLEGFTYFPFTEHVETLGIFERND